MQPQRSLKPILTAGHAIAAAARPYRDARYALATVVGASADGRTCACNRCCWYFCRRNTQLQPVLVLLGARNSGFPGLQVLLGARNRGFPGLQEQLCTCE